MVWRMIITSVSLLLSDAGIATMVRKPVLSSSSHSMNWRSPSAVKRAVTIAARSFISARSLSLSVADVVLCCVPISPPFERVETHLDAFVEHRDHVGVVFPFEGRGEAGRQLDDQSRLLMPVERVEHRRDLAAGGSQHSQLVGG